jgi:hypothetical protein
LDQRFSGAAERTGMSLLISFLYLLLHVAVIIFVAFVVVWLLKLLFDVTLDAEVYKWGKIIVGLLILIVIVVWIVGVLGGNPYPLLPWVYR